MVAGSNCTHFYYLLNASPPCLLVYLLQELSTKTCEALSQVVDAALAGVEALPTHACVPSLPAEERAHWVKQVRAVPVCNCARSCVRLVNLDADAPGFKRQAHWEACG